MRLSELQTRLVGNWTGNNLLRLSWQTPSDFNSAGRMSVRPIAQGKFLTFNYTWSHEGHSHEGMILLAHDAALNVATAGWVDSWHQSAGILACQGSITEQGAVELRGTYAAPPGPDWGWRITISSSSADELHLVMHNCAPDGPEDLAVQADYSRAC